MLRTVNLRGHDLGVLLVNHLLCRVCKCERRQVEVVQFIIGRVMASIGVVGVEVVVGDIVQVVKDWSLKQTVSGLVVLRALG